jgi:diguanylate cyclase (GGDEF)-like protein
VAWCAIERGEPVWIDDYPAHPAAVPEVALTGVRAMASYPLAGGRLCLSVARIHRVRPWSALDRELFSAIGRTVQVALDREVRSRALQEAAITDPLTDLRNRRAMDTDLASDLAAARRSGRPVTVLVLDVDGLKRVNDAFGHAKGDQLLRCVADALRVTFRQADRVYRYGGDEFAVVLRDAGHDGARAIRKRVGEAAAVVRARFPGADLSAGLAVFPDEADNVEALRRIADTRMYDLKWARRTVGR